MRVKNHTWVSKDGFVPVALIFDSDINYQNL